MSATTAPSPSDFGTPAFFTSGPPQENVPASNMTTPFNGHYQLSPMPEHANIHIQAPSPLNGMGHGDPVIANQSPPLTSMGRRASADMFQMSHEGQMLDDSMFLGDMSKQPMTLPFRAPMHDEQQQAEMDMNAVMNFGTIHPSDLGQDNMGM
jgi:hypothetical protein